MPRFSANVKLYSLDERAKGKGWKKVQQGIREKFSIEPPTIRAMQKWERKLDRAALSQELMGEIKKQTPTIETQAREKLAQGLIPVLWQAKDTGQDIELSGWKWFFSLIESELGSSKFEYIIKQYMKERREAKGDEQISN